MSFYTVANGSKQFRCTLERPGYLMVFVILAYQLPLDLHEAWRNFLSIPSRIKVPRSKFFLKMTHFPLGHSFIQTITFRNFLIDIGMKYLARSQSIDYENKRQILLIKHITGRHFSLVAVALWLGCSACESYLCICSLTIEANGYHGLKCQRSPGIFPRHHALNDIVLRALTYSNDPCTLEPPGFSRSDAKFSAFHVNNTSRAAASGAESAAKQKHLKYSILKDIYFFIPGACKTAGSWGSEAKFFIRDFGKRLRDKVSGPPF
ncbi:hypothetical protein EVAR_90950_1 [Eumeta japonica]|uniref:Uncharacterized protein n=1 Tax=Eumeta variegata TaxID=151549 RepID=A0A4C1ZAU7_EUMVA|nr:hypothetical protein EVAR_90950_1 [Eumeta japonica]